MNEIKVIDRGLSVGIYCNGQPVCTTEQLSEAYGADRQLLINNFNRNKERYHEGKHYICLTGEDLKAYKTANQNDLSSSRINQLYLWTERGALLHAKSLNTDKAWEVYERLVDFYFNAKEGYMPAANGAYKEKAPELDIHTAAAVKAIGDILANYNLAALHRNTAIKEPFAGFYDKHYYYILSALMYEEYKKQMPEHIQNGSLYQLLHENNLIEKTMPEHHAKKQCSPFTLRKMVDKRSYYLLPIRKDTLQALFKGLPC